MMTTKWRKARASGGANNCVELAYTLAAVRDSKNPTGPRLSADVRQLVAAVRSGRLG